MGKKSRAKTANKKLREQFNSPKNKVVKKLSKKGEAIKEYMDNRSFCDDVFGLVSLITDEEIYSSKNKKVNGEEYFEPVNGALLKIIGDGAKKFRDGVKFVEVVEWEGDAEDGYCIMWLGNGLEDDYRTIKAHFKPATDAEIDKYYS
jgi:hypothetical protein